MYQMSLGDYQLNQNRMQNSSERKLREIDKVVQWDRIVELFSVIDKTDKHIGGRPRKELLVMVRVLFIQHLYNLSDLEMEDQLNNRLSFKHFAGIGLDSKVRLSSIRSQVEQSFAYMERILNHEIAMAHNLVRNELRFIINCILYNVM